MPHSSSRICGIFLWLEAIGFASFSILSGNFWLLPISGILALLAALTSRGLTLAIPMALGALGGWIGWGSRLPPLLADVAIPYAVTPILFGIVLAFFGILSGLENGKSLASRLSVIAVVLHFLAGGILFADRFLAFPVTVILAWAASALIVIFTADTLLKLVSRLYTPQRHWATLPVPGAFFFFRYLGPDWKACLPLKPIDDDFSIRLAEMWMWPVVKKSLLALACTALAITWLGSSLRDIPPDHQGVRNFCGVWETKILGPGLHLSAPFPLGGIRVVNTQIVHEAVLGFRTDPGKPILWERAHYEAEERSLVGSGDDFLSISVPILYRIENPGDYFRSTSDAPGTLRKLGERVLLALTLRRPASELMTTAREPLRNEFRVKLQRELDRQKTGLHVLEIYFRDIHPPVEVAPFFQEVVSAMEQKEADIYAGEEYQRDQTARARGSATSVLVNAQASAQNRLLRANGEAHRFSNQSAARAKNPSLYDLREGFRVFDLTLGGTKKAIFDDAIRGNMPTHLDLRKVLNPDLVDNAMPAPQSLVPAPGKTKDAFDLDIEGFLKMDRGEVPAVDVTRESPNPTK